MKIYDFAPSPNARKVRSVVYELGLSPEFVPVDIFRGESREPEFLARNPNGKIPVLQDGGFHLWESSAIILYLAASHPSKGLLPTDLRLRADVDRWLFWQVAHFSPAVDKVAFEKLVKGILGLGAADPARVEVGASECQRCCEVLERGLASKEYLVGHLTVADFAVVSFFTLAKQVGLDTSAYPAVTAWLGRMLSRESVKRMLADVKSAMRQVYGTPRY